MGSLIPKPWELHPMLVHFPIAFLLGDVVLLLWASWRPTEVRHRTASGLLLAGYNLRKLLRWIVFSPILARLEWLQALRNFISLLQPHPPSP